MKERAGVRALSALLVTMAVYLILWQLAARYVTVPVYYYGRLIEILALLLFAVLAAITPITGEIRFDRCLLTSREMLAVREAVNALIASACS